jgi:hypothetical protein
MKGGSAEQTLEALREGYPMCNYPLVSIPEMRKAAEIIAKNMATVLGDSKKTNATVLVPGAGVSLNPLELARGLQAKFVSA